MGDAVDNIPGIKGVGEKTAAKLLAEFGTLENVLANAENIKGAMGEKIKAGKELALMSKKLATIITQVPVSFHEEDFRLKEWNKEALVEIFAKLEFKTIAKRIFGEDLPGTTTAPEAVQKDLFGNTVATKPLPTARSGKPGSPPAAGSGSSSGSVRPPILPATDTPLEQLEEASTRLEAAVERARSSHRRRRTPVHEAARGRSSDDAIGNGPCILHAAKNVRNTTHIYSSVVGETAIRQLVEKLITQKEVCFDTETTGIDPNNVELVGMSFPTSPGRSLVYRPCPADQIRDKTDDLAGFQNPFRSPFRSFGSWSE